MKHVIFFISNPGRTAQQIDTKLVHPFEKFRQNLLVKFYSIKNFKFLTHELKQRKTLVWVC